jgi:hypothetical protein
MQKEYQTNTMTSDFYLAIFQGIITMQQWIPESLRMSWSDTAMPG